MRGLNRLHIGLGAFQLLLLLIVTSITSGGRVSAAQGGGLLLPNAPRFLIFSLTSDRIILDWLPPIGGASVTSYQIQGGSAPGRSNLVNFDTFQNATKINLKIGEGQYFIRVRSRNAAGMSVFSSNEISVTIVGDPPSANPVFVAPTINITQDFFGDVMVLGEIQNRVIGGPVPSFIEIDATFTGPGGGVVGTDSTFVQGRSRRLDASGLITDTMLLPGQRGCFRMFTNIPASAVTFVTLGGTFDTFNSSRLQGNVGFGGFASGEDFFGDLEMAGILVNRGSRTTYFNKAVYDVKTPRVQDCDFAFVLGSFLRLPTGVTTTTALFPGQAGLFLAFTNVPFGPLEIRRWVTWEEAGPLGSTSRFDQLRAASNEGADAVSGYLRAKAMIEAMVSSQERTSKHSMDELWNDMADHTARIERLLNGRDPTRGEGQFTESLTLPIRQGGLQ